MMGLVPWLYPWITSWKWAPRPLASWFREQKCCVFSLAVFNLFVDETVPPLQLAGCAGHVQFAKSVETSSHYSYHTRLIQLDITHWPAANKHLYRCTMMSLTSLRYPYSRFLPAAQNELKMEHVTMQIILVLGKELTVLMVLDGIVVAKNG